MTDNNKVLTVSYGTFSCTLEGFDDSFDTMKAIAEYFRDLAADDRYFGAEPPQPDAKVLAAIAERELSRVVEGRVDGNTVTLRPAGPSAEEIAAQEAAAQAEKEAAEKAAKDAAEKAEKEAAEKQAAEKAAQEAKTAKRAAKEAAIAAENAAREAQEKAEREAQAAEALAIEEASRAETETTAQAEANAATATDPDIDDLAISAGDKATQSENSETVAEKLRRIRGVVSNSADSAEEFSEDQHAEDFLSEADQTSQTAADATQSKAPRVVKVKKTANNAPKADVEKSETKPVAQVDDPEGLEEFINAALPAAPGVSGELDEELLQDIDEEVAEISPDPVADEEAETTSAVETDEDVTGAATDAKEQNTAKNHGREILSGDPDADDPEMQRIIGQAMSELDKPDTLAKKATHQQLKAAVMAKAAEGPSNEDAKTESPYRDDLAQVVGGGKRSAPPLKLVASQRVDVIGEEADIKPRQVPTAPVAKSVPANFDEFLSQQGAKELPEILEAAAAYTTFVEGHDKFSRLQVMRKVSDAMADEYSREESLRAFGQLLRDGTLQRQGGGNFVIEPSTRFHPSARAAG